MPEQIMLPFEQRGQLIRAVLSDPNLKDSEAFELWRKLRPGVSRETFDAIRTVQRRPVKPLNEDNALEFVMGHYPLDDLLIAIAGKAQREAEKLRAIKHSSTADRLDYLAETLGNIHVPSLEVRR